MKIELPREEYTYETAPDGRTITRCTMRQIVLHTIGLDNRGRRHRPYTRHGRKFYRPWRNYFCTFPDNTPWPMLCSYGYAAHGEVKQYADQTQSCMFWLTRKGLDWLGDELGIHIYNEED